MKRILITPQSLPREIVAVSELNQLARRLLEGRFGNIWVSGEVSNLARPSSGHWYFSLKDSRAQIRCAMFRGQNQRVGFTLEDGMQVLVHGKASVYEGRGDFQLIVDNIEEAGDGALQRAFEQLKQTLDQQGLFAQEAKRPLPQLPHCIGVVTSPTGAAIHDILTVLKRRFAAIPIIIYPTAVQGKQSGPTIAEAILQANRHKKCDALILARGGGSLEDLWGFNEITVAKAIFESGIPIVSGIGHEVDITIADLVADQRAATPSAAAELICPQQATCRQHLQHHCQRLLQAINARIAHAAHDLLRLEKRCQHPGQRLAKFTGRLQLIIEQQQQAIKQLLQTHAQTLDRLQLRLSQSNPEKIIHQAKLQQTQLSTDLKQAIVYYLARQQQSLQHTANQLDALSPLATLKRGYAIVRDPKNNIVRHIADLNIGDCIQTRVQDGIIQSTVTEKSE